MNVRICNALSFIAWVVVNVLYFVFWKDEFNFFFLLLVLSVDLIILNGNLCGIGKRVEQVYGGVSLQLNLLRVFAYAYSVGSVELMGFVIACEVLCLPPKLAKKYFVYFVSSLPMQNYENFGKLKSLQAFHDKIQIFNISKVRSISYLSVIFLWGQDWYNALYLLFSLALIFTFKLFLESFIYYRYLSSEQYTKDLKAHTDFYDPEVILYVSGAEDSSYQLDQWVSVLKKLQLRVTVIVRQKFWCYDLPNNSLHTVYARKMDDIDNFIGMNTRLCLYPVNSMKNSHMMRNINLKHIFINHGESDKVVNQSRLLNAYDKLYLAGEMARDRMLDSGFDMPEKKYAYVGRPQTSLILKDHIKGCNTILYAPTWEGFTESANYCSIGKMGLSLVQDIIENTQYNIIFKPHPLTGSVDFSLKKIIDDVAQLITDNNRGKILFSGNILETMNESDMLITDISSVVNDFLPTGRPYLVTNPNNVDELEYVSEFKSLSAAYIVNSDLAGSVSTMILSIYDNDFKKDDRIALKKYSLGDFNITSFEKFELELMNDYASM